MKQLLTYILANIVEDPDTISIEEEMNGEEVVLKVSIPEEERGRVIGKNGTNIKAIRNIIGIIARSENKKVYIKIID